MLIINSNDEKISISEIVHKQENENTLASFYIETDTKKHIFEYLYLKYDHSFNKLGRIRDKIVNSLIETVINRIIED